MLTNKLFEDFTGQLLQVRDSPALLTLSAGQKVSNVLSAARIRFEDALSEKLRGASEAEQVALLTQVLTLFKESILYNPAPAYLWADLDTIAEQGCEWIREQEEAPDVKAFRDECESQLLNNPQAFVLLPLLAKNEASDANDVMRMVDEYESNFTTCQLEGIEQEDTQLDYQESRWLKERLVSDELAKAQEHTRKQFQGLAGREMANEWILNPDSWYDVHREALGLPWLQPKFQASYEAWHFYKNRPQKQCAPPVAAASPWEPLLLNYSLSQLTELIARMGLIDTTGQATAIATPGAWIGIIWALIDAKPARMKDKKAAAQRAVCTTFGATVSERAVQNGLGTRGSEAEYFYDSALEILNG